MIFRDRHEKSILPKLFIILVMMGSIVISMLQMFAGRSELPVWLRPYKVVDGDPIRCVLLSSCFIIYFLRLLVTTFVFLRRKLYWVEALLVANLMPIVFPLVAARGGGNSHPIGMMEMAGLFLFLFGSYLNTGSEYSRYVWKKRRENKGRLYTSGLFKYAMHINYFGDVLIFTGFAVMARSFGLLVIPAFMTLNFGLIIIPLKNRYLRKKYKADFEAYSVKTKYLIPFVY